VTSVIFNKRNSLKTRIKKRRQLVSGNVTFDVRLVAGLALFV